MKSSTRNRIEGKWTEVKGHVKERWGKLTDDDLQQIQGRSDQLIGKLKERYGYSQQRAEQECDSLCNALK